MDSPTLPMASLLSLPDELLDSILALYLHDPYTPSHLWSLPLNLPEPAEQVRTSTARRRANLGRLTLHALTLTCHRLYKLATPHLYHTFPTSTAMWYPTANRLPLRTCQFLTSLLLNPSLALHIRRLVLHPLAASFWAHESPFFPSQPPEYAAVSRRLESAPDVMDNIAQLGLATSQLSTAFRIRLHEASQVQGFVAGRIRGYEPIEAQLLLAIAPKLETLVWSDWRSEAGPEVAGMLRLVNPGTLRSLVVNYGYDLGTLDEWGDLGRFRALEKMTVVCGCERVGYAGGPMGGGARVMGMVGPKTSGGGGGESRGVKSMQELRLAFPCTSGIRELVAHCHGLRKLHIRLDVDFRMRDISQSWGRVSGSWNEIVEDLTSNAALLETVEDLTLDSVVKHTDSDMMTTDNWPVNVETLHGFRRLKWLKIHQSAFISFEPTSSFPTHRRPIAGVVPPTLETLSILCFDAGLLNQMDEFVNHLPDLYPELKKIEVQMGDFCCFDVNRAYPPHNLVRSSEDHIENLYQQFRKRGIDFVEMA
ncbi:hypothetical protein C1H76_8271 [Elsinoe australis]|uniref:Uncharacterized protein n=1 Tax=Elsinoe australis TaxID=40998 RepID=A0A4U7AMX0_9PEZI|nr:hypothetical protein C1H76_8271 [Elsinoe australis]